MPSNENFSNEPRPELTPEQFQVIQSALNTLAIAVSALPNSELLLGDSQVGPAAYLRMDQQKGLTIRYKPGPVGQNETPQIFPTPETESTKTTESSDIDKQEQEGARVDLWGRLGADPWFVTTKSGVPIGRFPLAVPDSENDQRIRWEKVIAFKKVAEKIQKLGLKKGSEVQVVGYARYDKPKSEKGKGEKQVYAIMVKPAKKGK